MERVLKPDGTGKGQGRFCLPGETGWMPWPPLAPGAALEDAPEPGAGARDAWLGLPARHLLAVPLWLQTEDEGMLRELMRVQLERRGALRSEATVWDFVPIVREAGRTLATAFVVDDDLPAPLLASRAARYDVAARFRALPEDGCALWREQGGIAAAFSRGTRLASLHYFPGAREPGEIGAELEALRRQLAWEGVCAEELRFVFLDGTEAPLAPEPPLDLVPAPVREERRLGARSGRRRGALAAAGLAYLLAAAGVAGALAVQHGREAGLASQVRAAEAQADPLRETALTWRELLPAVDPSRYPMECLLACTGVLPAEARLTRFEYGPEKVLLLGEGRDVATAFRFLDAAKKDPLLRQWAWTMPQPQLLPNNRAQFQLEGLRAAAAAH